LIKNKKILIVSECFYPEEFKINDVALYWVNNGFDVDILTLTPSYPLGKVFPDYKNSLFRKEKYKQINIFRLFAVTGYRDSIIKKILKYVNFMVLGSIVGIFIGKKYDYVFGFNAGPLTNMLPAVLIQKLYKKKTMFWVQDIWPDSVYAYGFKKTKIFSALLKSFVKFMHRNVTLVAISSKGFKSKLEPYVRKDLKFIYAPNWADDLNMNLDPFIFSADKKTQFTFAGNIGKVQNLENIINAFNSMNSDYQKKSQLNIIGDGSNLNNLKKIAKNNPCIIFYGKKNREDMAKYYIASDFLIISLIDEPIFSSTVPAKLQTYIAAKKPILAIIKGDVANIVIDNNLGISAEPSNLKHIKEAFIKSIDMTENEKSKFTINNSKLLKTIFNKELIIKHLTNHLVS
jgi:glycosyltransferase involved in cell wall biosynthesis